MSDKEDAKQHVLHSDTANEQVVLAAALVDDTARKRLVKKLRADHFFLPEHQAAWEALRELDRRKLKFDLATIQRMSGDRVDVRYLTQLTEVRGDTAPDNLDWHVEMLEWDRARLTAARGPVASLLEALRDPKEEPARVRAIARQVAQAFDGHGTSAIHEPRQLIAEQVAEVRKRAEGKAVFPYGVEGLDAYSSGRRRLVPGAAPGQVTVISGMSGSGKSTFAANVTLGLARQKRRVCYGAWEMGGGMTLELLACISLGWSRSELIEGVNMTNERIVELEERMHAISKRVTFMRSPFRRNKNDKSSNAQQLDIVQENLADSGAEVFIADLWKRCLRDASPEAEEEALYRQQAMAEEMRIHCILLQQQRLKDIEQRPDKRPTREGIKGSAAWVEVADTILGVHRPALWKDIPDDKLEVLVLKQRYGKWPVAVGFEWDADGGRIWDGHEIAYDHPGEVSETNDAVNFARSVKGGKRR
jgi:replicative DNA helicase